MGDGVRLSETAGAARLAQERLRLPVDGCWRFQAVVCLLLLAITFSGRAWAQDAGVGGSRSEMTTAAKVSTGADVLVRDRFAALAGKRVGLVTNHTGRVGGERLIDVLARAPGVKLASILTPEHGLGGTAEAGARVKGGTDAATGLPVFSIYGATEKPTLDMLRGLDVLVFDMQDIGVRYYTYISTMGLCMQAAAEARIPFVVLDRPNPLGGTNVSGFVLERPLASFIGRFAIPQVHGLTVGELAHMIKGERLLRGLENLELTVIPLEGWTRDMLWPDTGLAWVATSPNIPTFETALAYAGTGLFEQTAASEGRGTPAPFLWLGHPAVDAAQVVRQVTAAGLPGVRFEAARFTPKRIKGVASRPRFADQVIPGVRIMITDFRSYRPVETAVHLLVAFDRQLRAGGTLGLVDKADEFNRIAGTRRLLELLDRGASAPEIIASWQAEVAAFRKQRERYLRY